MKTPRTRITRFVTVVTTVASSNLKRVGTQTRVAVSEQYEREQTQQAQFN